MPIRNSWLPREGLTSEVVGPLVARTLLNPALTLPLVLLARYTKKGEDLSILHEQAFRRLKQLLYLGIARWVNNYLSRGALNNWAPDTYDWEKEIVVVTGGAGGIGGHVVGLLAEKGIKVVVLDIIPMAYDAPSNVHYFKCDITSTSAISSVAQEVRDKVGVPTILINNAGVGRGKTILDGTEKDVRFTFDVNTLSHYFLAKEFVPAMVARNHGMIVTVSSMAAYVTVPNMVDYAASKAAALSFHEGLAAELKTRYNAPRVRTVVVNPGYTKTALFQGYRNDSTFLAPTMEIESVAEAIVNQVLSGQSGQVIKPRGLLELMTNLKGWPYWMQLRVRNDGEKIMTNWHGRQVIDVEKDYIIKKIEETKDEDSKKESEESANGESESGILVPPTMN